MGAHASAGHGLTRREAEVMDLRDRGLHPREIAIAMDLSFSTIQRIVGMYGATGVTNSFERNAVTATGQLARRTHEIHGPGAAR